ncbi:hypothetical protein TNCV_5009601 [Trichonephila clavipes]|nr:hypothetical protein TNCV_5009601 [Trichonephila clavipes]
MREIYCACSKFRQKRLHWKTNSEGLPDLAHLSIWRENTWRERRPIGQINQPRALLSAPPRVEDKWHVTYGVPVPIGGRTSSSELINLEPN